MAKAELKTTASAASPADFIAALPDERKQAEAAAIRRTPPPGDGMRAEAVGAEHHRLWQL